MRVKDHGFCIQRCQTLVCWFVAVLAETSSSWETLRQLRYAAWVEILVHKNGELRQLMAMCLSLDVVKD